MSKTPAQQQIEALRRLKQGRPKAETGAAAARPVPPTARVQVPHDLPLGRETWQRLQERQRSTGEFRSHKEMGDWAAQLLLALPVGVHTLEAFEREDLFRSMKQWCATRGLQ